MKKEILLFLFLCPTFLFAQRGTIQPEIKQENPVKNTSTSTVVKNNVSSENIIVWQISENLKSCSDSGILCFEVVENGVSKTVSQNDVFGFYYELGNRYTISVKKEIKTPPVKINSDIYNYFLEEIISKQLIFEYKKDPKQLKNKINSTNTQEIPLIYSTTEKAITTKLAKEIDELKIQVTDLQQLVQTLQLQIELQMKMLKKE